MLDKINSNWKLATVVSIIVFGLITIFYFKPMYFEDKVLNQGDIWRHKAMSKEIVDFREKYHKEPLWTNSMFGGMPAYQISTEYSGNWLSGLDRFFKLFLPHPSGYLFLYGMSFFILMIVLRVPYLLAIAAAIAYSLSSYSLIIIEAGHNSKANAIGYMPLVVASMILLFKQNKWLGGLLSVLFWSLEINANHLQITYYLVILVGIFWLYWLWEAFKTKITTEFIKRTLLLGVSIGIAILPNMGNLLTTYEYGKYSTRGKSELTINEELRPNTSNKTSGLDKDYALQWSYGIGETFTFLIPDYKGGASQPIISADANALKNIPADMREAVANQSAYFGPQPFTSGPVYIGVLVVFLMVLGLFILPNEWKVPLLVVTLLSITLSWGKNFMILSDIFMDYVPGYNKFRAVAMILVLAQFSIPLLGGLALYYLTQNPDRKIHLGKKEIPLIKLTWWVFIAVGGFCIINYLAPGIFNSFKSENEEMVLMSEYMKAGYSKDEVSKYIQQMMPYLEEARKNIVKSDALRSFIFISLFFIFLWAYFKKKANVSLLFLSFGALSCIDLFTVDKRYFSNQSFVHKSSIQQMFTPTQADDMILQDTTKYYRVLNLATSTFNDATTSYFHKSVGGYHGAKLKKYQELIDFHLSKEIQKFYQMLNQMAGADTMLETHILPSLQVINMLNTKYILLPVKSGSIPMPNASANGNVWLIKELISVANADSEIVKLYSINTKTQAVIQEKNKLPNSKKTYSGKGKIYLTEYAPNALKYTAITDEEQFAVFSDIYYPKGWNAYIDGQIQPHTCVNYVLRGMIVPKGTHTIEFKFEPSSYKIGNNIAYVGSSIIYLIVLITLWMLWKEIKQ
ncbi:MAG: YfhO family protein [Bacteroidia bacterium]|nr:YfhO family protein [Bacteroidia bacterium]